MLQFLSGRLSVPARVLLVAACAGPPVAVLLFLFIRQTEREYRFTAEELKGAAYIAQLWPAVVSGGEVQLPASGRGPGQFGAEIQARAFVSASSGAASCAAPTSSMPWRTARTSPSTPIWAVSTPWTPRQWPCLNSWPP
ncbi:MAG: hypothetical protein WDN45_19075 [Caulobacteraceae bacterium]